jgi:hypothetical protein
MHHPDKEGKTLNLNEYLPRNGSKLLDIPLTPGYTVHDESVKNN